MLAARHDDDNDDIGYSMSNSLLYIQRVLFQTIQFNINTLFKGPKQFNSKRFSLAYVRSLNVKTVPFQTI